MVLFWKNSAVLTAANKNDFLPASMQTPEMEEVKENPHLMPFPYAILPSGHLH